MTVINKNITATYTRIPGLSVSLSLSMCVTVCVRIISSHARITAVE